MGGKKKMGVAKTLAEFGENASVHGISYITSSSSNHFDRLFWGCLVCLGLSVATYLSIEAFRDWNEKPVITTLKDTSRQVQTMEFPSVTICTEGVNMEAVKDALLEDFRVWKTKKDISYDSENLKNSMIKFLRDRLGFDANNAMSLENILKAFASEDAEKSVISNSVTEHMLACKKVTTTRTRLKRSPERHCGDVEEGYEYTGQDINSLGDNTAHDSECRQLCADRDGCIIWVRMITNGRCWTKTTMGDRRKNPNTVSGRRVCDGNSVTVTLCYRSFF